MIYTVTLNPSLDYIVELDQVSIGELNRASNESKFPCAKGINVSQVLNNLEVNSTALGFVGSLSGKYIEEFLQSLAIHTDCIKVSDDTRFNIKIKSELETESNAK